MNAQSVGILVTIALAAVPVLVFAGRSIESAVQLNPDN